MPVPNIERRTLTVAPEVRAVNDDGSIPMAGHAALFNSLSEDLGGFVEVIAPGAFKRTIKNNTDTRLLLNHDANFVLARTKSGTLRLAEDERGLYVEADMAPTSYARDLSILMERGDVNQMSFGFYVVRDHWGQMPDGVPLRTIQEAKVFDVSVVAFPAYPATEASLRSQQFDALIRTLGLSDLADEERDGLLDALTNLEITPERLPALIAARQSLESLIAATEATVPQPGRPTELAQRNLALLAQKYGLDI